MNRHKKQVKKIIRRLKQDARNIKKGFYRPFKLVKQKEGISHTLYSLEKD